MIASTILDQLGGAAILLVGVLVGAAIAFVRNEKD